MTKREALQILIDHAARNVAGVGCGIRPEISKDELARVVEAMSIAWREAYGFEMQHDDLFNRGIHIPIPVRGRQVRKPDRRVVEVERRKAPRRRGDVLNASLARRIAGVRRR